MSVCACGRATNDGRPACDRCAALALFGLTRAATPTEIKGAYRTLAKVWHPDRFPGDENLRRKAEEKLKEINSAYQLLISTPAPDTYSEPVRPAPQAEAYQRPASAASGKTSYRRPHTNQYSASSSPKRSTIRKPLIAVAAAILVAVGVWISVRHGRMSTFGSWAAEMMAGHGADSSSTPNANVALPSAAAGQNNSKKQPSSPATNNSTARADKAGLRTKDAVASKASLVVYPDEDPRAPHFTVGSSKSDVIRIQGTPTKVASDVFVYGLSEVFFKNGRVESWHTDPGTPLKATSPE